MTAATSGEGTHPVGVDFGGSGIKAALVDLDAGTFVGERVRIETPTPATLKPAESDTIERLTRPRWFKSEFQQLQDGSAVLVLDPLTTSG